MARHIYAPLVAYLTDQEADRVLLTFAQIEAMIGRPLARTPQVSPAFWIDRHAQRFPKELDALGWRAHLHVHAHAVSFRRIASAA
jgi:hypothetical protein